jgi:hypothetical protein
MTKINNLSRRMFPGTNLETSRQGGVKFTRSGLPLKGLLLPYVESFVVLGRKDDNYIKVFGIERAVDRTFLIHRLDKNLGNKFIIKALNRLNQYAKDGQSAKFDTLCKKTPSEFGFQNCMSIPSRESLV